MVSYRFLGLRVLGVVFWLRDFTHAGVNKTYRSPLQVKKTIASLTHPTTEALEVLADRTGATLPWEYALVRVLEEVIV